MTLTKSTILAGAASLVLATAPAADAQKSADTLRLAINDMFPSSDPYHFPLDENAEFYRTVYQPLVIFDEHQQKFVPILAKSYQRIDDTTFEFTLRDGVRFHNGDTFTADDAKATIDYVKDPKVNIRFKSRYDWVKSVEKLGPDKIRIVTKQPYALALSNLAYSISMLDAKALNGLDNKEDYGRLSPIGTGPYKISYVDRNKGILVERDEDYFGKSGADGGYYRAPVARVHGLPIPDRETQKAELMTGQVDLLRNITADDARSLAKVPNVEVTNTPSGMLLYVTLDAAGRSANKAMTDERVRKAFIMAIDRKALVHNFVPGGDTAELPKSICFSWTTACAPTTEPYAYDPEQAKRLLAEAGYPNGFDLILHSHQPVAYIAEAIAGELRKVGIRATVEPLPLAAYVKQRGDGDFTAFTGFYPTTALPDVENILDFFFGGNRDYWNDKAIHRAETAGDTEFDLAKRTKIYTPALDRVNQHAYILPISELPIAWAHSKDVALLPNPMSKGETRLGDFAWADAPAH